MSENGRVSEFMSMWALVELCYLIRCCEAVYVSMSDHLYVLISAQRSKVSSVAQTNVWISLSAFLSFSLRASFSSHGLVVLRKTSAPIVPHKAPNADTALA